MQSMTPTTAGSAPNTAAPSRIKGDEITVIASTVAPSGKGGQEAEGSFSKSTGFSTKASAKENGEEAAIDVQGSSLETAVAYADFIPPHKQGQVPFHKLGQAEIPDGHSEVLKSQPALTAPTLGQTLNDFPTNFGANSKAMGQAWNEATSIAAVNVKPNELAAGSLSRQHNTAYQQATSSGQVGTDTVSSAALTQRLANDSSVATSFTSKLTEVLASKSEQVGISTLNVPAGDVTHSAISQGQSPSQASPTRAVWANMQMDASPGKWGEQMLQVLQDRVSLQANQNLQEARIRLDPPDLGKLDLVVRVDGDRLNVQINANNGAVRDALVQVSERLRAELQQQQFIHVDVNVGTGDQGQASYSQPQEDDSYQPVILGANENADNNTDTTSEHWLSTTA